MSSQRVAATFSLALRGRCRPRAGRCPGPAAGRPRGAGRGAGRPAPGGVPHLGGGGARAGVRSVQSPETALASRPALGPRSGSLAGSVIPVRVSTTVVVSPPVRATPTTWVVTGSAQLRSTSSVASSPTPWTRYVDSSWTRGLAQPAYHPSVVRVGPLAARPRRRRPRRTGRRSARPSFGRGRAGEGPHQRADAAHVGVPPALAGEDQPVALGVAGGRRPRSTSPGKAAPTWPTPSSASGVSGSGGGGGVVGSPRGPGVAPSRIPLVSSSGRTPAASVTSDPETSSAATAAATPTVVCERRRAEPARIRIEGRGQRTESTGGASASRTRGPWSTGRRGARRTARSRSAARARRWPG